MKTILFDCESTIKASEVWELEVDEKEWEAMTEQQRIDHVSEEMWNASLSRTLEENTVERDVLAKTIREPGRAAP